MKKERQEGIPYMAVIVGLMVVLVVMLGFNISRTIEFSPVLNVQPSENMLRNTLTVTGRAELTFSPDEAWVYLSIVTEDLDAKKAQDDNRVIANAVIDAIKMWGVSASDIETETYSLSKIQDWDPDLRKYIDKGYRLTHTIKVTTTRINDLGDLVDTAVGAGANQVQRVTFTLSDQSERSARDEALKKAAEPAKEKAQLLATSTGATLGEITHIQEQDFYYTPFEYRGADLMEAAAAAPTTISPEKVEIRSTVQLIFEIE
jgi:uncharacterized protein YggE